MSKYCPMCDTYTNCTDNCKYCLEELENEQKEEHNKMIDTYKMTLSIYHIDEGGESECKGEPFMIYISGVDLCGMKENIDHILVFSMKQFKLQDGLTRVVCDIEKNGEYFDCDEGYYRVDLTNNTAKFLID